MGLRQPYVNLFLLVSTFLLGAAPSRTQTYTAGQIISPTAVTENEDNVFSYLQAGVDTYATGSVNSAALANGTIVSLDVASETLTTSNILNGTLLTGDIAADTLLINNLANEDWGDISISSNVASIDANSVVLTTDTTGFYAAGDAEAGNATGLACTNCVAGTELAMSSDAQGDILYYNGTDYVRLAAGTSGQFLQTQGASANPQWAGVAFENGRVSETTAGGTVNGTDVSVTLDVASYVSVILTGDVTTACASPCTIAIRRDTTSKETSASFTRAVGDSINLSWSEALASGTYAFDIVTAGDAGWVVDYQLQVTAIPQ